MGVSALPSANSSSLSNELLSPVRHKMKVLKKIKKRIGFSTRSISGGPNNLPPLQFHHVHGDNVRLAQDGAIARRVESFCRGVAFTSRPIKLQEKVFVKFLEVSNNWSGVLRFGLTSTDPSTLRHSLPKYACPDLTNKPGYWAKALAERFSERGTILFFYVTSTGDVHFGINGEEKGIFFSGVDTRGPLWGLFDIYGNSTGIEIMSPRNQLNNVRSSPSTESVLPALENLRLSPVHDSQPPPPVPSLIPLPFHKTRGRNIRLSNDRTVATRSDSEFCHGYVFTARPIRLDEKIVIQVLSTESMYVGALTFGLTSCDPASLSTMDLPEDADSLLDRREYWVINKDVANIPERGDELVFCVTSAGQVTLSKNGGPIHTIMHVDHTLELWALFDVYGSTQKIRLAGIVPPPMRYEAPRVRTASTASPPVRHCCLSQAAMTPPPPAPTAELLQIQPTLGGGTVLVVNLPPTQSNIVSPINLPVSPRTVTAASSASVTSSYSSNNYNEPISSSSYSAVDNVSQWMNPGGAGSECSVCYERSVDSVLYMCGHMCMCYECAVQQWRGKGGGHCPLCRAVIRDVIRTYKS